MEQLLIDLPRAVLEISALLGLAVLAGLLTRRFDVPLTAILAVVGLMVSETIGDSLAITELLNGEGFEQLLVNLFLPILIFEAAFGLSTREFMRNLAPIAALATVALVISATVVGLAINLGLGVPLVAALLFGVIISATDPVAVVAVFKELGVSNRVLTLVEGESLLNDGVAIVGSAILLGGALGTADLSVGGALGDFAVVVVGGMAVGAVIGTGAVLLLPLVQRLPAAALTIAVAYGSFVAAESALGLSGVMATVAAGVVMGGMVASRASRPVRDILGELWEALSFVANALLFLLVGLALDFELIAANWGAIMLAVVAVLAARPLAVVPTVVVLERLAHIPKVGLRNSAVVVWGGLRGGVALALALALPAELAQRELFIALTGGVVLATLLINATTMPRLVRALGLDRPSRADVFLDGVSRIATVRKVRAHLAELGVADESVAANLDRAEADALSALAEADLGSEETIQVMTLRGLHIQREAYLNMSDAGLFPPIAARTLLHEIEDEIEELTEGELRVDAPRRAALPWYGRLHRRLLHLLPGRLGEDLTEVNYIEVSARKLAAHQAAEELGHFMDLPDIDPADIEGARTTFLAWERRAMATLDALDDGPDGGRETVLRRQAQALGRISAVAVLHRLTDSGVISEAVAGRAEKTISAQVDHGA